MSYTKQTWTSGDVITANKLNHIEDGIENVDNNSQESLIIEMVYDSTNTMLISNILTSDVVSAFQSGRQVIVHIPQIIDYLVPESYVLIYGYRPADNASEFWTEERFAFSYECADNIYKFYTNNQGYFCGEIAIY